MEDTALYTLLLGIQPPWRVTRVEVALAAERIDVWVEEAPGTVFPCAGCAQPAPVYDHTAEQVWRHLDTCQCQTYVHAQLPRTSCPVDGVKQLPAPWAEARSQFMRNGGRNGGHCSFSNLTIASPPSRHHWYQACTTSSVPHRPHDRAWTLIGSRLQIICRFRSPDSSVSERARGLESVGQKPCCGRIEWKDSRSC